MRIHDERPEDELTANDRARFFEALNRAMSRPGVPGLGGSAFLAARVDEAIAEVVARPPVPDCWIGEYLEQDGSLFCVYGVDPTTSGRNSYGRPIELRGQDGVTRAPSGVYIKPANWDEANARFCRERVDRLIDFGSVNQ